MRRRKPARPALGCSWAKRRAVAGFSRGKARAVLAAYAADSHVPAGEFAREVEFSIAQREGVFLAESLGFGGPQKTVAFTITDEWRRFLGKERNRALVEART